jgi:hypothetical protein
MPSRVTQFESAQPESLPPLPTTGPRSRVEQFEGREPTPTDQFHRFQEQFIAAASSGPGNAPLAQITSAAMGLAAEPILDMFGPQAPLTDTIFNGTDNFGTRAVDAVIKLAPLAVGIGAGSVAFRVAGKIAAPLAADILSGAAAGVAGGAAEAVVRQRELAPSMVFGGVLGAAGGAVVGKLSKPGRELAKQYAGRPDVSRLPDINVLDETIPHVPVETLEILARRRADVADRARKSASEAFRRIVPAGGTKETVHPAVWRMARKEAATAARAIRSDTSLEGEGEAINRMFSRVLENVKNHELLQALKSVQSTYVTRLSVTLARDKKAFGTVGGQFADRILRNEELKDHMEGRLVDDVLRPLWRGVPKYEEELIDRVLHGEGGRLSNEGLSVVGRWREIADHWFKQGSELGLMEEVTAGHPAAIAAAGGSRFQATMVPAPEAGPIVRTIVQSAMGNVPKTVPLQYKANWVPYYIDRKAMGQLATKGNARRSAFLQKLVKDGEADNIREAERLLEELLEVPHAGTSLHIRSPFQHERQLALQLPRERNARVWMRRAAHDHARRLSQAKVWGPQDELFYEMKEQLKQQGGDVERLEKLFRVYVGRPPKGTGFEFAAAGRSARAASTVTLLGPRVGLLQFMQLANTAARTGIKTTAEAIVAGWRNPELRLASEEVGALLPSEHLLTTTEPVGRLGEWWIKFVTQMPRFDRAVRQVSALAGGLAAKDWAREYWRLAQADAASGTPSLAQRGLMGRAGTGLGLRTPAARMMLVRRRLEEGAGIPVSDVMKHEGELPIELVQTAMRNVSHKTQFASTIMDMPEAWRTTGKGRFIYTLRTFAKQQSAFVTQMIDDAVRYGDTGPITRFLIMYPTAYHFAKPYLDFLSGREFVSDADQPTLDRVRNALSGAMWTGMWGGMGDFINQLSGRDPKKAAMSAILGAPVSQAINVGSAAASVPLTGNTALLERELYRNLPVPIRAVIQNANR